MYPLLRRDTNIYVNTKSARMAFNVSFSLTLSVWLANGQMELKWVECLAGAILVQNMHERYYITKSILLLLSLGMGLVFAFAVMDFGL